LVSLSVLSKNAVGLELQNPNSLAEMGTDISNMQKTIVSALAGYNDEPRTHA